MSASAQTQTPLYIVNGVEMESVRHIPEENIEHIETLPADEQTIARYGDKARNGVVIIALCYDREAQFDGGRDFDDYIAEQVHWPAHHPAARVVVRYTVESDGSIRLGSVLQATNRRLYKRVVAAVEKAPKWSAATKSGTPVASEHVLRIQLPKGKPMPRERYIVIL